MGRATTEGSSEGSGGGRRGWRAPASGSGGRRWRWRVPARDLCDGDHTVALQRGRRTRGMVAEIERPPTLPSPPARRGRELHDQAIVIERSSLIDRSTGEAADRRCQRSARPLLSGRCTLEARPCPFAPSCSPRSPASSRRCSSQAARANQCRPSISAIHLFSSSRDWPTGRCASRIVTVRADTALGTTAATGLVRRPAGGRPAPATRARTAMGPGTAISRELRTSACAPSAASPALMACRSWAPAPPTAVSPAPSPLTARRATMAAIREPAKGATATSKNV
jgi:hypothetical protein